MARRNGLQTPSVVVVQLLGGPYVMEVRPRNAGEEFRIALAGPACSLALVVVFGVVATALSFGPINIDQAPDGSPGGPIRDVDAGGLQLLPVLVNLVPGYPMDGARVLHASRVAANRPGGSGNRGGDSDRPLRGHRR